MPSAARLGDLCSGHSCYPPRPSNEGSSNVYINGIPSHREGDGWSTHCCDDNCHTSTLAKGSSTVFVNGKGAGRIGDPVGCGSAVARGSLNVFIGG